MPKAKVPKKTSSRPRRSRRKIWIWFVPVLLLAAVYAGWTQRFKLIALARKTGFLVQRYQFLRTGFPQGDYVHGFDMSRYQGLVDWERMVAVNYAGDTIRFKFAFFKATEGLVMSDPYFERNWEEAGNQGFIRGAYHYFKPARSARVQALNFISGVDLKPGDLPPVIDVEETGGLRKQKLIENLKEFSALIETHYGVKPIIYSNRNFITNYLNEDFKAHPFWVAHYHGKGELKAIEGLHCAFWQHTDRGRLLGCAYPVDLNVFRGSEKKLKKLLITTNSD